MFIAFASRPPRVVIETLRSFGHYRRAVGGHAGWYLNFRHIGELYRALKELGATAVAHRLVPLARQIARHPNTIVYPQRRKGHRRLIIVRKLE